MKEPTKTLFAVLLFSLCLLATGCVTNRTPSYTCLDGTNVTDVTLCASATASPTVPAVTGTPILIARPTIDTATMPTTTGIVNCGNDYSCITAAAGSCKQANFSVHWQGNGAIDVQVDNNYLLTGTDKNGACTLTIGMTTITDGNTDFYTRSCVATTADLSSFFTKMPADSMTLFNAGLYGINCTNDSQGPTPTADNSTAPIKSNSVTFDMPTSVKVGQNVTGKYSYTLQNRSSDVLLLVTVRSDLGALIKGDMGAQLVKGQQIFRESGQIGETNGLGTIEGDLPAVSLIISPSMNSTGTGDAFTTAGSYTYNVAIYDCTAIPAELPNCAESDFSNEYQINAELAKNVKPIASGNLTVQVT